MHLMLMNKRRGSHNIAQILSNLLRVSGASLNTASMSSVFSTFPEPALIPLCFSLKFSFTGTFHVSVEVLHESPRFDPNSPSLSPIMISSPSVLLRRNFFSVYPPSLRPDSRTFSISRSFCLSLEPTNKSSVIAYVRAWSTSGDTE